VSAIEAVVALLAKAGTLPLSKVRPVIAEALGRKRLADSIMQPVLDDAQRLGRFKVEQRGRTTAVILIQGGSDNIDTALASLPKPARAYYESAIKGPPGAPFGYNGRATYGSQIQSYATYYKARKAQGFKACHPLLWMWGHTDPTAVAADEKKYAREVLER